MDADALEHCIAAGGVAVFPADTVYGLACDATDRTAVERLYALKRRPLGKPSAVMFFDVSTALAALPELGAPSRQAFERLLPGGVTLLLANPHWRFPLACGDDPSTLGVRVPDVPRLRGVRRPVLQSSANLAGGSEARRLDEVPEAIRASVDLVLDGGELPGVASTVVDLRRYENDGLWSVVRRGMVGEDNLREALGGQYQFRPESYEDEIREDLPAYDELQQRLIEASGTGARSILELGTGTGTTAALLLERHPDASLIGVDASERMLIAAREQLPAERVELRVGQIEDELPGGPFDLIASALSVHHLDAAQKAALFKRIRRSLTAGGRFVLADVVVPEDPADARTPLTAGFDKPSPVADQLRWLAEAGFDARVVWEQHDLAVVVADATGADMVAPT